MGYAGTHATEPDLQNFRRNSRNAAESGPKSFLVAYTLPVPIEELDVTGCDEFLKGPASGKPLWSDRRLVPVRQSVTSSVMEIDVAPLRSSVPLVTWS